VSSSSTTYRRDNKKKGRGAETAAPLVLRKGRAIFSTEKKKTWKAIEEKDFITGQKGRNVRGGGKI